MSFDPGPLLEDYDPQFAMAYGSGVFAQEGYKEGERPMIDMVFAVEDTEAWHTRNLEEKPEDYSSLAKFFGLKFINWLQGLGAKIYYHPYVPLGEQTMKYGVMSEKDLLDDLREWRTLYVAGRLHKPVHILRDTNNAVQNAMELNFEHALNTALLLLPANFTEQELFETIAGLSYTGDSRMGVAENPGKVKNIVGKNREGFGEIYRPRLVGRADLTTLNGARIQQSDDPLQREERYRKLPENLVQTASISDFRDITAAQKTLRAAIANIVKGPSVAQTLKGIATAGPAKSAAYAGRKVMKRFQA